MPIIQTTIENRSQYPIDIVWENAQDLEHVAFLHRRTNASFTLLHTEKTESSRWAYETLIYHGLRRVGPFHLAAFGFRRILRDYQLHQIEYIPALRVTSALNSRLIATNESQFPTLLRDEVVMEAPFPLSLFRRQIVRALHRHATIQCQEDESFRQRRTLLKEKGILLPYRVFFETQYEKFSSLFGQTVGEKTHGVAGYSATSADVSETP